MQELETVTKMADSKQKQTRFTIITVITQEEAVSHYFSMLCINMKNYQSEGIHKRLKKKKKYKCVKDLYSHTIDNTEIYCHTSHNIILKITRESFQYIVYQML